VNLFSKASGFSQALKTGESVVTVIHDEDTTRENPSFLEYFQYKTKC